MDAPDLITAIWAAGALLWFVATRGESQEIERLKQELKRARSRALEIERIDRELRGMERLASLAHIAAREAREVRGGIYAEPSEVECMLATRLCEVAQARQRVDALQQQER